MVRIVMYLGRKKNKQREIFFYLFKRNKDMKDHKIIGKSSFMRE